MRSRGSTRGWGLAARLAVVLAGTMLCAAPAWANEPTEAELAAARALFKEGKELETQNAWAEALERFKKVGEVKSTPQVRFHVALCEEHLGRLVAAINGFEQAEEEAKRPGANADDVAENAPVRAEALRKRVPHIRFEVSGQLESSKIMLDGAPVAAALVGASLPVDPGKHTIEVVTASGTVVMHKELELKEQASERIAIDADAAPKGDPTPKPDAAAPLAPTAPPGAPPAAAPSKLPAIAVGAAGVLSLAGAGVFLGLREASIAEVTETCDATQNRCDPAKRGVAEDGQTYTTVANILLGVGAAGIVTAGVLWVFVLTPSSAPAPAPKVGVTAALGGLRVVGSF